MSSSSMGFTNPYAKKAFLFSVPTWEVSSTESCSLDPVHTHVKNQKNGLQTEQVGKWREKPPVLSP